ncbi:hypothetical protein VPX56_00595 [Enterobacter wuhouensis]|uniref:Chaperone protein Skp n=1 Tax=Enterobacter wuhouensis TaxID=2529381 RepID=A0ABZ1DGC1_9ENTR|nr:hypothetical protein [Enterobacter wuhouensis]WRW31672.1 hypothetical protein VPX56_00595 [Enterobacter wuhouensis]
MKSRGLWIALGTGAALLALMLTGCDNGDKGKMSNTIRFVDTQKVMVDSGLARQEAEHLQAVYGALKEGLALVESHYGSMEKENRQQAEQSDRQILEMQWQAEQRSARQIVNNVMLRTIAGWQQKKRIDAVLPKQSALALNADMDVTADITDELRTATITFGKLPEINLKQADSRNADQAETHTAG